MNVLQDAGCTEDETRLVRLLLTNTILRINVNDTLSIQFQTSTGAFQGDAASGNLFTVVEAAALIHLRAIASTVSSSPYVVINPIPNPPVALNYMPLETEYSDDINFNNTCLETLQQLFPIAKSVFEEYNLFINPDKTEYVHFYFAEPKPKKKKNVVVGATYRGDEPWRTHKTIGSLICSEKVIKHRDKVIKHREKVVKHCEKVVKHREKVVKRPGKVVKRRKTLLKRCQTLLKRCQTLLKSH